MLNSVGSAANSQFFRQNRDNPDYLTWRREADRMAQTDPALAEKLRELDGRLAVQQTAANLPRVDTTRRPTTQAGPDSDEFDVTLLIVLAGGAALGGLWIMRRRADRSAAPKGVRGLAGGAQSRFRVGMTFPVDPTPFLLAANATKVVAPQHGGLVSAEAIGVLSDGSVQLNRIYLPGRTSFLQLHLARTGEPDECRYFSQLDEVTPSSEDEWGFWLDPAQGMIGWPQFQTKDGKLYDRVWAPGASRVQPRQTTETMQDLEGTRQRKLLSMLYGARTGAAPPAPDLEYILVSAVQDGGQAWVEVHAGIDINPAALSLPSVSLAA